MQATTTTPLLRLAGIVKRYPTVTALGGVRLEVAEGEIHAVLGENGAGKSTLMKIIYGVVQPDDGAIAGAARRSRSRTRRRRARLGIGMVFQHFALFETLTVAENIALALPGRFGASLGLSELAARIAEVSRRYGLPVDPRRSVHELSVGERQRVEIVRCLLAVAAPAHHGRADLGADAAGGRAALRHAARARRAKAAAILYISHKLDEIRRLCDRATVLRGGHNAGEVDPRAESEAHLAELMIGRSFPRTQRRAHARGAPGLEVSELSLPPDGPFGVALHSVSLNVHRGEILGIAGVSGNGQDELLAAVSGERRVSPDEIRLGETPVGHLDAGARRGLGLAFVPEERLGRGAVPDMCLAENALLTASRKGMVRAGLVDWPAAEAYAARCIREFDVDARRGRDARGAQPVRRQPAEVHRRPRDHRSSRACMVARAADLGRGRRRGRADPSALLDLAAGGVAVLVVSEDLDEILEVCDRVAVMAGGRLSPVREVGETHAAEIGAWMAGGFLR